MELVKALQAEIILHTHTHIITDPTIEVNPDSIISIKDTHTYTHKHTELNSHLVAVNHLKYGTLAFRSTVQLFAHLVTNNFASARHWFPPHLNTLIRGSNSLDTHRCTHNISLCMHCNLFTIWACTLACVRSHTEHIVCVLLQVCKHSLK